MKLLDLIISGNWLMIIGVVAVFFAWIIIDVFRSSKEKYKNNLEEVRLIAEKNEAKIDLLSQERAAIKLEQWKEKEMSAQIDILAKNAFDAATNMLDKWKVEEGDKIRKDAVKRSMAVNLGKITEHLIPFSSQFKDREFNPQDARFIGSPVDLILFDGVSNSLKPDVIIYFLEVKTGKSSLTESQRRVRDAVKNKRVEWLELTKGEFSWES